MAWINNLTLQHFTQAYETTELREDDNVNLMHFADQTRFLQYTRDYGYLCNCRPLYLFENISFSIEITYFRPSAIIFLKFARLLNTQESKLFDKSPISSLHTRTHTKCACNVAGSLPS
jgi:hypothetical protein